MPHQFDAIPRAKGNIRLIGGNRGIFVVRHINRHKERFDRKGYITTRVRDLRELEHIERILGCQKQRVRQCLQRIIVPETCVSF
jgi:hypothetical protein